MSPHRIAVALAVAACALLALAPSASAWWGDVEVRKVNVGGPASDTFTFKVEARRAGAPAWTLLPAADYTGLPFGAKAEPDNPFVLRGALLLGEPPLLHELAGLLLGDAARLRDAGIDQVLADVLQHDGNAGGGDRLRDLAAHGAGADDGGLEHEHGRGLLEAGRAVKR